MSGSSGSSASSRASSLNLMARLARSRRSALAHSSPRCSMWWQTAQVRQGTSSATSLVSMSDRAMRDSVRRDAHGRGRRGGWGGAVLPPHTRQGVLVVGCLDGEHGREGRVEGVYCLPAHVVETVGGGVVVLDAHFD